MKKVKSLQDRYAPKGICFGCGSANKKGLQIKSFPEGDTVIAEWKSKTHHQAWTGTLNGGIIGSLLDCHSNWTAAYFFMKQSKTKYIPSTVTAEFSVKLLRPTPSNQIIHLSAKVVESSGNKAVVDATLSAAGKLCATCNGVFVRVEPGHPAYHRWE